MNKNQKIALGCGVAGCLGLILIVIIFVVLGVLGYVAIPGSSSNRNYNYNSNADRGSNSNTSSNSDSSSSSTMSNDDKHKLFQAVGATKDNQLLLKVLDKIGFPNASGPGYNEFMEEHLSWAMKNFEFMDSVNTAEKGRAYVEAHIDD